jgi:hypothetical protein
MFLVLAQPVVQTNTWNLYGNKGLRARKADNLTAIFQTIASNILEPLWASSLFQE